MSEFKEATFTLADAIEIFQRPKVLSVGIAHADAATFIAALNKKRIKFQMQQHENPELIKFVRLETILKSEQK